MSEPVHIELTTIPKPARWELRYSYETDGLRPRRYCVICERDTHHAVVLVVSRLRDGAWFSICRACASEIAEAAEER